MSNPIVLATSSSFGTCAPEATVAVEQAGYKMITNPHGRKLTEEELLVLMKKHRPMGLLAGTEPVTRRVMESCTPGLKVISRIGVGWDNVDHEAAQELGIPVLRTVGVLDQAVAELTLGMILGALRHISFGDRKIRAGHWEKRMGGLLQGKTVGIVGFGAIGRRVAELTSAFGAIPVFMDTVARDCDWCEQMDLGELLLRSDILTIHASGNRCLIGRDEVADFAKPGAIVVNTARGGMVDESALADALATGGIAYACLDVFEHEPYDGSLAQLDNTVLTPHIGSYAVEAREAMEMAAVKNLLSVLV